MSDKPNVLIVDDEEGVLAMYKIKLEMEGFSVSTALDGQTALEMISKNKPDVILLDIIMPKLNGFDILKILKSDKETANIPVFLLTNLPQESGGEKGKELGAAGYLVKADYEPAVLAGMLKEVIKRTGS